MIASMSKKLGLAGTVTAFVVGLVGSAQAQYVYPIAPPAAVEIPKPMPPKPVEKPEPPKLEPPTPRMTKSESANPSVAQQLPGPAAGGWFILMGPSPDWKGETAELACYAIIVVASDANNPASWKKIYFAEHFEPEGKYGPYSSEPAAAQALVDAGWGELWRGSGFYASSGCTKKVATRATPPIKTPQQSPQRPKEITRQAPLAPEFAQVVTVSEVKGVRQKIRPCWNTIGGAKEAPVVTLVVQLNQHGTPTEAQFKDSERYNNDSAYRSAADAARRAVLNPRCQPWPLSPERYSSWRSITFTFDPRDY